MSYILAITIGRNVSNAPMSQSRWDEFRSIIRRSLESQALYQDPSKAQAYFIEEHVGTGEWEGIKEESSKITLVSEHPVTLSDAALKGLGMVASIYDQNAVAVTTGTSILVNAD